MFVWSNFWHSSAFIMSIPSAISRQSINQSINQLIN
jgi:hypothetical protein